MILRQQGSPKQSGHEAEWVEPGRDRPGRAAAGRNIAAPDPHRLAQCRAMRRPCGRLGPLPRPAGLGGGRARPGPGPPARPHGQRVTVFRSRHRGSSPLPDLTYGWRSLDTSCPIPDAGLLMTAPRRPGRATANPRIGHKIAPFMLHTPTSDDHGCCREHEAPPRIYN